MTAAFTWRLIFWASLAVVIYTYLAYPALIMALARLMRRRSKTAIEASCMADDSLPTVTMIISAYNEQAVMEQKIANCLALDYPADKLLFAIGSDGSDDGTADILQRVHDTRFRILLHPRRRGKVRMLNDLVEDVHSDIIVFSDANTMYDPQAIRQLTAPFADKRIGVVIGNLELRDPQSAQACHAEGAYWRYENAVKAAESAFAAVPAVNGGIFAVRRGLFTSLPCQAITEDQVLGMKIMAQGYLCCQAIGARAWEYVSDWRGEMRRRIRISAGNFQSLWLVREILNPFLGRLWFTFVSHKLLRWLVPFCLVLILVANTLLAGEPFYGGTLLVQGLFYAGGLAGTLVGVSSGVLKLLAAPKYFLTMNLAVILGLCRILSGRQRVTWARSVR
ncbi:MAG: glycosyltransferase family 2 protein [Sedimentisphaerales bacterium]|nr:glycosyltransferase family 2 protein [Sedimentisphaerales bacterium]